MNSNRTDVTIIITSAVLAVLAIAASVLGIGQPIQLLVTLGGIMLGPGGLAYRLMTGARWGECLKVGVAINIAALMVLGLTTVAIHFWHPKVELLIPLSTCVLAGVLYRRVRQDEQRGPGYQNTRSYRLGRRPTWELSIFWATIESSSSWAAIHL